MRRSLVCALVALMPFAAIAAESPSAFRGSRPRISSSTITIRSGISSPHAVRTFTNALAVAAADVRLDAVRSDERAAEGPADYGNARRRRRAAQHAALRRRAAVARVRDVSGERAHVLADEPRAGPCRDERHRVRGGPALARDSSSARCSPQSQHPESLLYSYLTVPRFTAPRWYLEGGAVFMETWMGGGLGRAQGGYDEMVFRAMVRDDAHFYDPLGLVSRGIRSRFPGRRQRLPLRHALLHLARLRAIRPRRSFAWLQARRGQHGATTPTSSSRCSASRSSRRGSDWIAFEQRVPADESRRSPQVPDHAAHDAGCAARSGSVSRTYYDEATRRSSTAPFATPGIVEHVGALNTRDGSVRQLADIKRAMLYRVASFAYDPASGTRVLHQRQPGVTAT